MKRFLAFCCIAVMLLCPAMSLASGSVDEMRGLVDRLFGTESLYTPEPGAAPVSWPTAAPTQAPDQLRVGERIIIQDDLDLLSSEDEQRLTDSMAPLTKYGTIAFWTTEESGAADRKAMQYYQQMIGGRDADGVLFMIDMDTRTLYIFSRGKVERLVTRSDAYAITTDNSHYATGGQYYTCAREVFADIFTLLEENQLHSPVRTVCCLLMGCAAGMMSAALISRRGSIQPTPSRQETTAMKNIVCFSSVVVGESTLVNVIRHENSSSSSGGGSSGGGGGSSGGGGGSSCGSGGGSSF